MRSQKHHLPLQWSITIHIINNCWMKCTPRAWSLPDSRLVHPTAYWTFPIEWWLKVFQTPLVWNKIFISTVLLLTTPPTHTQLLLFAHFRKKCNFLPSCLGHFWDLWFLSFHWFNPSASPAALWMKYVLNLTIFHCFHHPYPGSEQHYLLPIPL